MSLWCTHQVYTCRRSTAFYGCLYAGCVPITVRPPHPQNISTTLPTVKMIVEVSHSACVMTTAVICTLLRSKEAMATVDIRNWPPVLATGVCCCWLRL
ncbi:disco-interacting protein 2 homolog C [Oreochromis niloticus]|uniref:disco-interacting protein 2 homolog C n=1 Tax=Oreochromis niloticus TaxID=8128 RepID=UPI0003942138|nr:disco-interacting protein 2 homolog C [Oreochromis niloticus]